MILKWRIYKDASPTDFAAFAPFVRQVRRHPPSSDFSATGQISVIVRPRACAARPVRFGVAAFGRKPPSELSSKVCGALPRRRYGGKGMQLFPAHSVLTITSDFRSKRGVFRLFQPASGDFYTGKHVIAEGKHVIGKGKHVNPDREQTMNVWSGIAESDPHRIRSRFRP
jgi:hypothetical protein